ncbi:MAG: TraB/GumN family protein [Flavobacteriales bacterium]
MKKIISLFAVLCPLLLCAQSLLWKVSGNGLKKPSYLYGTMHVQDNRVFNFTLEFEKAFKSAKTLCLELDIENINQMEMMQQLIMPDGYAISTLISEEDYKLVEKYFKDSLGQSLKLYDKMTPMFVASMISLKDMKKDQPEALDAHLAKRAKAEKKTVIGLETLTEQVSAFKAIPYKIQAENLVKAIKEIGNTDEEDKTTKIMDFYVHGQLDSLYNMVTKNEDYDEETAALFHQVFLVNRNKKMAERSIPHMKKSSVFIAVGAAHLGGEDGVIAMLREQGYIVEPVLSSK